MNKTAQPAIRDAATVLVLRDHATAGLEVLLLRRSMGHVFGPGAVVFPGGRLEAADKEALALSSVVGRGWPDADWRMAAMRECFEETGLLLVDQAALPTAKTSRDWQQALIARQYSWFDLLATQQLALDLTQLQAFDEWTTPPGLARRYRTRFYAVALECTQEVQVDGQEIVSACWQTPDRALHDLQPSLMLPTRRTLERLTGYTHTAAALADLAKEGHKYE